MLFILAGVIVSSETKITLSKFVFIENLNSWGKVTLDNHENSVTTNSNESTIYVHYNMIRD